MIKTVLFDLDDTILDFQAAERTAIRATFDEVGAPSDDATLDRYSEINRATWQRLERGELTRCEVLVERFKLLFAELGIDVDPVGTQNIYEHRLSLEHPFIEGGRELLDALYGKYALYIASNGTPLVQDRRIADSGIVHYFNGIFISERIGANKPSREFFDAAFAQIDGLSRDETMIVGDSLTSDVLGGINAGIRTCYFNPKRRENNTDITPDYEIRSLSELPTLLERI